MKTLEIKPNPYLWAEIPLRFPCGEFSTQGDWAVALGSAYTIDLDDADVDVDDVRTRLTDIARALPVAARPGLFKLFWLAPDPDKQPLLLNVNAVMDTGNDPTPLQELAGAYESDAARPPIVDQLETEQFGTVSRVLTYVKDDERKRLTMRISIVGFSDGVLVRLDAFTADLSYGILAVDPITEFMATIRVEDVVGDSGTATVG